MFDNGIDELDVDQTLDRAAASRAARIAAEIEDVLLALHFADLNAALETPPDGGEVLPGTERLRVHGGEGCPAVAEFAVMEYGARIAMSPGSAADYVGDALALRHRFPKTFTQMLAGHAEPWRARRLARACLSLTLQAAGIVDDQVNAIINTLTPHRLGKYIAGAKMHADPDKAKADAEFYRRRRGVWLGQSNDHGTKTVTARTAVGDAARLDAAIEELAEILAACGDTDSRQERRARALGLLADPEAALRLREHGRGKARKAGAAAQGSGEPPPDDSDEYDEGGQHGDPDSPDSPDSAEGSDSTDRYDGTDSDDDVPLDELLAGFKAGSRGRGRGRAPHSFYVHITDEALLSGEGVARVEGIGPLLVSQLKELIANEHVVLKPVIDQREHLSVDAYEAPQRMREWLKLRYPWPMVPWATTETTFSTDLDHVIPYDKHGPPGQTSTTNLIPVTRATHNAKTFAGWRDILLPDGSAEWTTRRGAHHLIDHTGTTYLGQINLTTGELTPPPAWNTPTTP